MTLAEEQHTRQRARNPAATGPAPTTTTRTRDATAVDGARVR
jgi:hypothetical protein